VDPWKYFFHEELVMEVKQQKAMVDLFEQAMDTYNSAFKTGIKMQEDTARWWADLMGETSPVQDWQKRAQAMMADAMPLAQKTAEEALRVIEQNSRTSLDLLRKVFDTAQSESVSDARDKIQGLWEASLGTLRENAQALVQANAKTIESWSEFMRKNFEATKTPEVKSTAKTSSGSK
jgi:BMFP domain-containing protein YqiC